MQDQPNRPSQKSYISAPPSGESVLAEARQAVKDALILNPNMPAVQLAEMLRRSKLDFAPSLHDILESQFYAREARRERRKQTAADRAQYLLPGFEHLPVKIGGTPLLDLNYTGIRAYYRALSVKADAAKQNNPKLREAKALMEKMRRHNEAEKGITVRQVLLLEV